jgi:N-hydroxyarylamine O-acetyltransferase
VNINAYLQRIRFAGVARPDFATLRMLHRAHQLAVPFENLDVLLGRPPGLGAEAAYEKIVERRRGGWCYEMNGLFEWALRSIGFEVKRLSAGVMREQLGDDQLGNHLCLLVHLDRPYLLDVGFGGSLIEPLPLAAIQRVDAPHLVALEQAGDGYWRFAESTEGTPFSFDFRNEPADEALLARQCRFLGTNPSSMFVQNLVVQQRTSSTHLTLRGRVLTICEQGRREKTLLNSAAELVAVLREKFALDVPEAVRLWPDVCARHEAVFAGSSATSLPAT